jgi:hypothetical protein
MSEQLYYAHISTLWESRGIIPYHKSEGINNATLFVKLICSYMFLMWYFTFYLMCSKYRLTF